MYQPTEDMMRSYEDYIARKTEEYGEKFDPSDLAPQFVEYFESGERIKVESTYGEHTEVRTGTVGITTGWRPAFLLMRRSNAHGSSDLLSAGRPHRVTHVQHGKTYRPVACEDCGCPS